MKASLEKDSLFINRRLMLMPASTDGPSGPRLFPVPSVAVAAKALRVNRRKSFRSEGGGIFFVHDISSKDGVAFDARIESRSTFCGKRRNIQQCRYS